MTALLSVRGLRTVFPTRRGPLAACDGVDLDIHTGEALGVVGESGSGKSVTFLSVLGLVRPPGRIEAGEILFDGTDLARLPPSSLRALRGRAMALAMQDALSALNPAFTIGTQIVETILTHRLARSPSEARDQAVALLRRVGIPSPERRLDDYPHQFSGGMRQRAMIAIALAGQPRLLVADEPTTALDVTIRAQVLDLIDELREETGLAVAMITHDLGVVAERCARVMVMYAGQVVETGPTAEVIAAPRHPYTRGLMASLPSLEDPDRPLHAIPGQVPDLARVDAGCRFRNRCPLAIDACAQPVALRAVAPGRFSRCLRAEEVT
ncbi:ABC transporter ATP-binding protein [Elioraea sp. Yellowstone]|jgi:oligopeptide/dipeptide ABC transporter ATP-binding protein|uniref:ABC transporter ATP-binding protein n=1 Tax=Elioraea sp. Yellowstone TaxID=2592070 RepID=UPI001151F722|nr:ABC transporter ATP-binding protein [Elioraea sp. Yellowstone]TQF80983.1 ABC transporter ATP-binding protein [Elioraea sp. Yellowstone]